MSPVPQPSTSGQTIRSVESDVSAILAQMNKMNRIAIVEDKNVIRAGFEKLVGELDGCVCVGAFGTAEEALARLPSLQPDIVIMDIHLPNLSGIECTARLKALMPTVRILMVTVYEDEEKIFNALKAGASGYILKRSGPEEIVEAIEELRRGGAPMTSAIARRVVESFLVKPAGLPAEADLSRRELEILECLARGDSNKKIAQQLSLSPDTVRWHLQRIYDKLHVQGRTEAAVKFLSIHRKPSPKP
jgi:DNA-binding NarL/FixJ family response regulator